jgi:hypothetical protein
MRTGTDPNMRAWRPETPPAPEIARSVAPPRPMTPPPADMVPQAAGVPAHPSLRDPNERAVLRSEPPPMPSSLPPDHPQVRPYTTQQTPDHKRLSPKVELEAEPNAPSLELAVDLPVSSQRSGQWNAVRPEVPAFDATSRATKFADDLMLPWVGPTPEPPRPTSSTRRVDRDRR